MSMDTVSVGAQLTFVRLWLVADDAGWLDELERVGCISRHRVGGRPYLRVVNWRKHQRIAHPTPSKLPGESAGVREAFVSVSGTAIESIGKPV